MNVAVDQPGDQDPVHRDGFLSLIGAADAGDHPVADSHIARHDLMGQDIDDLCSPDHQVGRFGAFRLTDSLTKVIYRYFHNLLPRKT